MKKENEINQLFEKIAEYKKKYYKNILLKGVLIGSGLLLGTFIFINFLEYFGRFGSTFRAILFVSFIAITLYTLFFLILKPIFYLFKINEPISDTEAASQIGKFFPNIKDKLLNTLQLAENNSNNDNSLIEASIAQKSSELKFIKFADAINLKENRKYFKYALPPLLALIFISAISPKFFNSTERIVYFKKDFVEPAPFQFKIKNESMEAIKNEDFELNLTLIGNTIPENVYLVYNDRKFKMNIEDPKNFSFVFSKIQEETDFHFLAAGYKSATYNINLKPRPNLLSFSVKLKYPSYLNKTNEEFDNVGNLIIPEGTQVEWKFKTDETDSLKIIFDDNIIQNVTKNIFTDFSYIKKIKNAVNYEIALKNKFANNADKIAYYINVIPDKFPQINIDQIKDTTLYNYIGIGGTIADDYGLTDFKFLYRKKTGNNTAPFKSVVIPFNKSSLSQSFFHQININQLDLDKSDQLEYYLQITDNDGVNGNKSTKTSIMSFSMPTAAEFDKEVQKQVEKTEEKFEDLIKKSKDYKKALDDLDKDLKKKTELDFQDKKEIDDLLKKKQDLMKELKELQKEVQQLKDKQNRFEKQSPELQQKMDMLQKLLNELMKSEDTKALEELKKMLEEQLDEKSMEKMDNVKKNERNLDKNIERTLNLFKNLQLKQKVNEVAKELEKLAEKQEELANKTEKENQEKSSELKKEQEKLNKEFDEQKEKIKDIEKLSEELKKEVDTQKDDQKDIDKEQENAEKQLDKKDNKAASKSQSKAAKSMRNMASKMSESMQDAEMKQMDIDIDALRDILENLIKISHDQEGIMKNFKNISVSDPRFVKLSQDQLKIAEDTKIIEDSLYSLAKRVMQIESFITKEVTDMKNYIDESSLFIKERKLPQAASKQQFSMTSMNNLALMLSDTFKQMQEMMAMSMPGSGSGGKKGKNPMPGIGEMQQQINEKIDQLGEGQGNGKTGKQLSEELAKIANEQAKVRKQIQELQEQLNGTEAGKKIGNELKEIEKQMDETENDLVNKRINPTLKNRQKQIETRLLEAEKAIKEQELDPKRKSNAGVTFTRPTPPDLEKFKKENEKQLELIRTTPPNFTPFYKKQTDNYFKKIN
jgi:septal ring factor EnvC (AmiA/AmiB activator)